MCITLHLLALKLSCHCKVKHIGNRKPQVEYTMQQENIDTELETTKLEKDIGVHVDDNLKFDQHVELQCGKANKILGMIRRSFTYIDKQSMTAVHCSHPPYPGIRPCSYIPKIQKVGNSPGKCST